MDLEGFIQPGGDTQPKGESRMSEISRWGLFRGYFPFCETRSPILFHVTSKPSERVSCPNPFLKLYLENGVYTRQRNSSSVVIFPLTGLNEAIGDETTS